MFGRGKQVVVDSDTLRRIEGEIARLSTGIGWIRQVYASETRLTTEAGLDDKSISARLRETLAGNAARSAPPVFSPESLRYTCPHCGNRIQAKWGEVQNHKKGRFHVRCWICEAVEVIVVEAQVDGLPLDDSARFGNVERSENDEPTDLPE